MISAKDVNPRAWANKMILFDNSIFSVIAGDYKNEGHCLGIRWNGDPGPKKGFPVQGRYPLWFVIPNSIRSEILFSLKREIQQTKYTGWEVHFSNLLHEIEE